MGREGEMIWKDLEEEKNMKLKMEKITVKKRVTRKHSAMCHHDQNITCVGQ